MKVMHYCFPSLVNSKNEYMKLGLTKHILPKSIKQWEHLGLVYSSLSLVLLTFKGRRKRTSSCLIWSGLCSQLHASGKGVEIVNITWQRRNTVTAIMINKIRDQKWRFNFFQWHNLWLHYYNWFSSSCDELPIVLKAWDGEFKH